MKHHDIPQEIDDRPEVVVIDCCRIGARRDTVVVHLVKFTERSSDVVNQLPELG